jgi:hypothetical protein
MADRIQTLTAGGTCRHTRRSAVPLPLRATDCRPIAKQD